MEIDTQEVHIILKESLVDLHISTRVDVFFPLLNKKILSEDRHSNPSSDVC